MYYRKKHEFTILDLSRIAFKIHAPDDPSKLPGFYAGVMAVITSLVGHLVSDLYFRVGVDPLGALLNFWVSLLVSFYNAFVKWGGLAAFLNTLLSLLPGYKKEE